MTRLMIALLLLAVPACSRHEAAPTPDSHDQASDAHTDEVTLSPDALAKITLEAVQARPLPRVLPTPARVDFDLEAIAHVGAPIAGTITEIHARVGDLVAVGAPIVTLRSPAFAQVQSEFLQNGLIARNAAPLAALAKASWERARTLQETSEGVSLNEVQRREAEYLSALQKQTEAALAAEQAGQKLSLYGMSVKAIGSLKESGNITPTLTLFSPIAGELIERHAALGEHIEPGAESLAVIAQTGTLWVIADVPEASISAISPGTPVRIIASALPEPLTAVVSRVGAMVDPRTRTAPARIVLQPAPQYLRAGMFVRTDFQVGSTEPVLAIPESAVQLVEGSVCVFIPVPNEPGIFRPQAIQCGDAVGGWIPVSGGLERGDQFVASGSFLLKAELAKGAAEHSH